MNYLKEFFEGIFPNPAYRVPVVLLFIFMLILIVALIVPRFKNQRVNLVLGITIIALFLTVMAVTIAYRWQWVVGLLPTLMVGYQLFFLWLYQPKEVDKEGGTYLNRTEEQTNYEKQVKEQSYKRALESISNHFNIRALFIRYGLPGVLLGITGIIILDILVEPKKYFSYIALMDPETSLNTSAESILRGIKFGAIGAYVYVLLELGRRTFRHDITGAIAMWCWVTLVLGPLLAATVALLWHINPPPDSAWAASNVVLFFTGFAPRRVIAAIEQAAAQLLKIGPPPVVESRLIPLGKIRGISPQIEDRLSEEGITDVNSLAAAEPIRLVRNTSFDMRQILSWIDEAILIVTLPRGWEALEEEGITGAIDLAWYYDQMLSLKVKPDPNSTIIAQIENLAAKAKFDNSANLVSVIQRLYEDTQVQYIWALYNNFTEFSGADHTETNGDNKDIS